MFCFFNDVSNYVSVCECVYIFCTCACACVCAYVFAYVCLCVERNGIALRSDAECKCANRNQIFYLQWSKLTELSIHFINCLCPLILMANGFLLNIKQFDQLIRSFRKLFFLLSFPPFLFSLISCYVLQWMSWSSLILSTWLITLPLKSRYLLNPAKPKEEILIPLGHLVSIKLTSCVSNLKD